jgi:dethiobiotin synthetase
VTRVFVTATGTDVGKTFVACALAHELRARGWRLRVLKPVATGFDARAARSSDTGRLLIAQGLPVTAANLDATTPWRFRAPLSPDMAARREKRSLAFADVVAFCAQRHDVDLTLIEGIGGVMVPLDAERTVLDWIARLRPAVVLVAGSYLGTLSHTLTAVSCLRARGLEPTAVVVSESAQQPAPLEETADALRPRLLGIPLIALPRADAASPTSASESPAVAAAVSTLADLISTPRKSARGKKPGHPRRRPGEGGKKKN